MKNHALSRRSFLYRAALAQGALGLRSLLLGLPPAFLTHRVMASGTMGGLIFSERQAADPINANVPGTYISGVRHPAVEGFLNPPEYRFGTQMHRAAAPWGGLPEDLRARLSFFHHQTGSSAHPESPQVMTLFGSVIGARGSGVEQLPSAIAQEVSSSTGSVQPQPISLAGALSYEGIVQSTFTPSGIKSLFGDVASAGDRQIAGVRDQLIDRLYKDLKVTGTPAQKKYLDEMSISRTQAQQMGEQLSTYLTEVSGNSSVDQVRTAVALLALKITPVVRIALPFGGDNHNDISLEREVEQTIEGVNALAVLWSELKKYQLQDSVTFASLNVFGRTLDDRSARRRGRDHNRRHSTMVWFGPSVKGGVIGAVNMVGAGEATAINSVTGLSTDPDIVATQTHAAAAKTLMSALGISESRIETRVMGAKIVRAALA